MNVAGIVSLVFLVTVWLAPLGVAFGVLGFILSILGYRRQRSVGLGTGMAIAGIATSSFGTGIGILIVLLLGAFVFA